MKKFILIFFIVVIIYSLFITPLNDWYRVLILAAIICLPAALLIRGIIKERKENKDIDYEYLKQKIKLKIDDDIKE